MMESFEKRGRASVQGTEVLRWKVSLPMCGGRISEFYEEIGRRAVASCEGELSARAVEAFDRSDDPKKRFSFPAFLYRLEACVTYENEKVCSVHLTAELRRRGEQLPMRHYEDGQVWEKSTETLLPPDEVVRIACKTKLSPKEKKRLQGVLLSENGVLCYDGSAWNKKEIF